MKNVSFLIVDEDQSVRSMIKSTVYNQLGSFRILSAVNGLLAKAILQKQSVDIIISGLDVSYIDGFELLAYIKSHPKFQSIPLIMMTSGDEKRIVIDPVQKDVSQYLVKPFTAEKLESAIRRSWYSAEKRRNTRISHLPDHKVSIQFSGSVTTSVTTSGRIINISQSGILIELVHIDEILLFANCIINIGIKFSDNKIKKVKGLVCKVIRMEAQCSNDRSSRVSRIAVHIFDDNNDSATLSSLNRMMDALADNKLNDVLPRMIDALAENETIAGPIQ